MPIPKLEVFTIRVFKDWSGVDDIVFSPEFFPQLTTLGLRGIQTPSSSAIFSQLKRLELRDWDSVPREFLFNDLARVLRNCVNIEELLLADLFVGDLQDDAPQYDAQRVTLSKLRFISIHAFPQLVSFVLNLLDPLPYTASIQVSRPPSPWGRELESLLGARCLLPEDRSFLLVLRRIIRAELTMTEHEYRMAGFVSSNVDIGERSPLPNLELSIQERLDGPNRDVSHHASVGYIDFLDIFRPAPLETLRIAIRDEIVLTYDWRAIFKAFPRLQSFSISVRAPSIFVPNPFFALDPTKAPEGTADNERLLCPNLREMHVDGSQPEPCHIAQLAEILQSRKALLGSRFALETLGLIFCRGNVGSYEATRAALMRELAPLVGQLHHS
ncbi:hypothetical protein C8Q76DRAFT_331625 [Earliella scabrosa]|nr:hypothetical protein C8Q76DRAFT_331625 [Earliella scabrosa]